MKFIFSGIFVGLFLFSLPVSTFAQVLNLCAKVKSIPSCETYAPRSEYLKSIGVVFISGRTDYSTGWDLSSSDGKCTR